jgi:hypothetical protein
VRGAQLSIIRRRMLLIFAHASLLWAEAGRAARQSSPICLAPCACAGAPQAAGDGTGRCWARAPAHLGGSLRRMPAKTRGHATSRRSEGSIQDAAALLPWSIPARSHAGSARVATRCTPCVARERAEAAAAAAQQHAARETRCAPPRRRRSFGTHEERRWTRDGGVQEQRRARCLALRRAARGDGAAQRARGLGGR